MISFHRGLDIAIFSLWWYSYIKTEHKSYWHSDNEAHGQSENQISWRQKLKKAHMAQNGLTSNSRFFYHASASLSNIMPFVSFVGHDFSCFGTCGTLSLRNQFLIPPTPWNITYSSKFSWSVPVWLLTSSPNWFNYIFLKI